MGQEYLITRDNTESERLETQHTQYTRAVGYLVHPTIAATLPPAGKVAELAAGTCAWLLDVASQPRYESFEFDAFDLSDAQYPDRSQIASNVGLHVADVRNPLPAQFHNQYDLVHVRLVLLGLDEGDWDRVIQNILQILKPGGWLQWSEVDATVLQYHPLRHGDSAVSASALHRGFKKMLQLGGDRIMLSPKRLVAAGSASELQNFGVDQVSSDRLPELRNWATKNVIGVFRGILQRSADVGEAGSASAEENQRLLAAMIEEADAGAYVNFHICTIIGRKPIVASIESKL